MTTLGKSANLSFQLDGKGINAPIEWQDIEITATFDGQVQANITSDKFTFVLDSYTAIKQRIAGGLNGSTVGIFEGMDFDISALSTEGQLSVFQGFLDMQDGMSIDDENGRIECSIKKLSGINTLSERLETIDFGYLKEIGVITQADYVDVEYVVVKINTALETIISGLMIYNLTKSLIEGVKGLAESIAGFSGISASGVVGIIGATIFLVIKIILQIAYIAAIIVLLVELGRQMINAFVPPIRKHKGALLKTLLEKVATQLGYGFNTSIDDLDYFVYLPSNINTDEYELGGFLSKAGVIEEGIPNATDYGYLGSEIFDLAKKLFNGRYSVVNNIIQFHTELSPYWIKQSTWIKPDVLQKEYKYNTKELKSNINIAFSTDINDEYTIDNFTGTVYQVITDANTIQDEKKKTIVGLDRVSLRVALGNRKDKLTSFEKILARLAGTFDAVTGSNLKKKIKNRVGMLKVSDNYHTIPKILYMSGGKIPQTHRQKLSAKVLWEEYHIEKSFIHNNFKRQRRITENEKTPFGFVDFVKLIENSYFYTEDNQQGKVNKITWRLAADYANIDYYVEEVYTKNLKEIKIEP